jgi:hypothetical protein
LFAKRYGYFTFDPEMKQFITDVLTQFQKGEITLQEATDRLLTEKTQEENRKTKSNRRLKELCSALQREEDPSKVRELKDRLSNEFYHGDQAQ